MTKPAEKQLEAGAWNAFADALIAGARSVRLADQADSLCRALGAVCPPGRRRVRLRTGAPPDEVVARAGGGADAGTEVHRSAGHDAELGAELTWAGAAADRAAAALALAEAAARVGPLLAAWATLRRESATDPLTGAGNRRGLEEHLAAALSLTARHRDPVSVLMLDADRFKDINDRDGHAAGDRALTALADGIRGAIRTADRLYRYGGDEFVLVLPHTDAAGARRLAQRIRADAPIPISIGASAAIAGDTTASLLQRADQALLDAKRRHG